MSTDTTEQPTTVVSSARPVINFPNFSNVKYFYPTILRGRRRVAVSYTLQNSFGDDGVGRCHVNFGYSVTHPNDNHVKRVGRALADGRREKRPMRITLNFENGNIADVGAATTRSVGTYTTDTFRKDYFAAVEAAIQRHVEDSFVDARSGRSVVAASPAVTPARVPPSKFDRVLTLLSRAWNVVIS